MFYLSFFSSFFSTIQVIGQVGSSYLRWVVRWSVKQPVKNSWFVFRAQASERTRNAGRGNRRNTSRGEGLVLLMDPGQASLVHRLADSWSWRDHDSKSTGGWWSQCGQVADDQLPTPALLCFPALYRTLDLRPNWGWGSTSRSHVKRIS